MLNHPTFDQLKTLKLDGMADAFAELQEQESANDLGHAEWLALLLDREAANRTTKRVKAIAKRQTAAVYLKALASEGILDELKAGRENLYINPSLLALLSERP